MNRKRYNLDVIVSRSHVIVCGKVEGYTLPLQNHNHFDRDLQRRYSPAARMRTIGFSQVYRLTSWPRVT